MIKFAATGLGLFLLATTNANALAMPTWDLHCLSASDANQEVVLNIEVTRTEVFTKSIARLTYFASSDGKGSGDQELNMAGTNRDARSQLFIDLTPVTPLSGPAEIASLALDLSYEFSMSTLTLNDGTKYSLSCKSRDFR